MVDSNELTDDQKRAVDIGIPFLENFERDPENAQQTLCVEGPAGTGKSTAVKFMTEAMGLDLEEVAYATVAAKAADVLRKNGLPADTIASKFYSYIPPDEDAINECAGAIARATDQKQIRELKQTLAPLRQSIKTLNPASVADIRAIVLYEGSMINHETANDILSLGRPLVLIQDRAQLPPPKGLYGFEDIKPNVTLTQITRQAQDSPIIRLSMMARRGQYIKHGRHGDFVWKSKPEGYDPLTYSQFDQTICGYNKTRVKLNKHTREVLGYRQDGILPIGPQEKLIVRKNRRDIGVFNGQFITMDNIAEVDDLTCIAEVRTDTGIYLPGVLVYTGRFIEPNLSDEERKYCDHYIIDKALDVDFGYALTCHLAQGSGFPKVCVYDDGWGAWDKTNMDRRRWLYTAITRASEMLVIFGK